MSKEQKRYLYVGGLLAGLFVLFSIAVKRNFFGIYDLETTVGLQSFIPRWADAILSLLSLLGSLEITSLVLIAILFLRKKIAGIVVLGIFLFVHLLETLGKSFLNHPGPPEVFDRYDLPFNFPSSYVQPGYSYPSGHSLRALFLALIFWQLIATSKMTTKWKKIMKGFLIILTFLMLISRVSLGEHWLTDVLGGSLLGLSFGYFSLIFF